MGAIAIPPPFQAIKWILPLNMEISFLFFVTLIIPPKILSYNLFHVSLLRMKKQKTHFLWKVSQYCVMGISLRVDSLSFFLRSVDPLCTYKHMHRVVISDHQYLHCV